MSSDAVVIQKYECMLIVDAKLSSEEKDGVVKSIAEMIGKNEGKVINSQVWQEKQKLTFEISKCKEGTFYLIKFEGPGTLVEAIRTPMKLNEKILRSLITKID